MQQEEPQIKILAQALFEIRVLLASYLGSDNAGDSCVRQAAHLAYALHNEALSVIDGASFETGYISERLMAVDRMLGSDFSLRFAPLLEETQPPPAP
jgi:hypothetical protein